MEWEPWKFDLLRMIHGQTRGAVQCRWHLGGGRGRRSSWMWQSIRAVLGRVQARGGGQEPWKGDGLGRRGGREGREGQVGKAVGK